MPLRHRPPRDTEILSQFCEATSAAPENGQDSGHTSRLPQVSTPRKRKMLTPRKRRIKQVRPMELARKIKRAREEAGFTSQRALAKAINVSYGLVGQWESHEKSPGRKTLEKLARATGKPLSYFGEIGLVADEAVLETRFADEIEMVMLYRRMSPEQQRTHLALFRQSVSVRAREEP